jgi:hypothetical protein
MYGPTVRCKKISSSFGMQVAAPTGMIFVVCHASLKLNWRREIKMVDPDAKIEVLTCEVQEFCSAI